MTTTTRTKQTRNAVITAAALEVHCPYCGEPQPNPDDGSHLWFPLQVESCDAAKSCVSCDRSFKVLTQKHVSVGE